METYISVEIAYLQDANQLNWPPVMQPHSLLHFVAVAVVPIKLDSMIIIKSMTSESFEISHQIQ